jgi:hypothetical protein
MKDKFESNVKKIIAKNQVKNLAHCKRLVIAGLTGRLKMECFQNFKKLSGRSVALPAHE